MTPIVIFYCILAAPTAKRNHFTCTLGKEVFVPLVTIKIPAVKVKAFPLQAWTGPEGSRRLRLTDF
jgi:hypothetical protein